MCWIFWYFWNRKDAASLTVQWLKNLEYRWYDSWGLAYLSNWSFEIKKEVWKISDFSWKNLKSSHVSIWHSRWATHWKVTKENAHPHFSEEKDIIVVHNWIIENFEELRKELIDDWHVFSSDTDTEVIPHLIEKYLSFWAEHAFKKALARLEWRFAIVTLIKWEEKIFAARIWSPLIVWLWKDGFYLASDITAFLSETKIVNYVDDEEMLTISKDWIIFENFVTWEVIKKRKIELDVEDEAAEKWDYEHFMLKEIMEQKKTISSSIDQDESEIFKVADAINKAHWTFLIWCWTAWKVCQAWEYFLAQIAAKHVNSVPASEFPIYHKFLNEKSLVIAVSQSWETADVLEAIQVAKKKWATIISLVNAQASSIERISDFSLNIKAGPEIAVASTKAATSQLSLLLLIAHAVAWKLKEWKQELVRASAQVNELLNPRYLERIKSLAKEISNKEDAYIIWKAANFPMALEAAIKIQEVSYIHAEWFAWWELKHWPIALIHDWVPCITLCSDDETYWDIISNTIELKSRGAYIVWISPKNNSAFDFWIRVPNCNNATPIVNIIPVQILSYYLAVERSLNPDKPRNLAKSVTVK